MRAVREAVPFFKVRSKGTIVNSVRLSEETIRRAESVEREVSVLFDTYAPK